MRDREFDEHFSKKLKEEGQFPFDEKDWEGVSKRLDDYDTLKAEKKAWWQRGLVLLPLLLLLLGSNAWFLYKMNGLNNQNTNLANQLGDIKTLLLKQQNETAKTQAGTIYQRDTVIIYKYLPAASREKFLNQNLETAMATISFLRDSLKTQLDNFNKTTSQLSKNEEITTTNTTLQSLNDKADILNKNVSEIADLKQKIAELTTLLTQTKEELALSKTKKDTLNSMLSDKKEPAKSAPAQPPITKASTKNRFFAGLSGGLINYKGQWYNRDSIQVSKNVRSWQVGMKAEYALNDQWRLMFGGEFCPFDVRITWNDARYNLPEAPLDLYPTSKFTLRYRNAKQNIVEGYFGIKHLFKGERWRPYIGLGHMTMRILPFETEFEFQKNWGTEIVEVTKKSDGKLISNMMLLSGGWEWQILPRLAFQTEGFYYKDINKTKRTYDQFGLRGALILGFK